MVMSLSIKTDTRAVTRQDELSGLVRLGYDE